MKMVSVGKLQNFNSILPWLNSPGPRMHEVRLYINSLGVVFEDKMRNMNILVHLPIHLNFWTGIAMRVVHLQKMHIVDQDIHNSITDRIKQKPLVELAKMHNDIEEVIEIFDDLKSQRINLRWF